MRTGIRSYHSEYKTKQIIKVRKGMVLKLMAIDRARTCPVEDFCQSNSHHVGVTQRPRSGLQECQPHRPCCSCHTPRPSSHSLDQPPPSGANDLLIFCVNRRGSVRKGSSLFHLLYLFSALIPDDQTTVIHGLLGEVSVEKCLPMVCGCLVDSSGHWKDLERKEN
ncbi:hypothetical protein RRG08_020574 [Elysia crispata]|uniref:Uncharacterized protein n=1 Tax=Elysia crispata TaxID=231223 RepID=A0AAE1A5W7_9GAST|nr:hypothetical protein RRG08_020574 [Elysia crispata]